MFIVYFLFYNKNKINYITKDFKYILIIYSFLFVVFVEWFLNHPSLRYGGYVLIASLFFIPLKFLLITILIFSFRNYSRINDEIDKYDYKPLKNPYYYVDDNHFRYQKKFDELINNYYQCKNKKLIVIIKNLKM